MPAVRKAAMRWTLEHAASEFEIDRRALQRRLVANSAQPDSEGRYGTHDICAAKFGDIDGAKLRLLNAQAKKLEREDAAAEGRTISIDEHERILSDIVVALRQTVMASVELSPASRSKLLQTLETNGNDAVLLAEGSARE